MVDNRTSITLILPVLVLLMICIGCTGATGPGQDATSTTTTTSIGTITIHFEKPAGWSNAWIWFDKDRDGDWETTVPAASPGDMDNYRAGWYRKTITDTSGVSFIFNDGSLDTTVEAANGNFESLADTWVDSAGIRYMLDPETIPVSTAVPYTSLEAEDGTHNGTLLGPSTAYRTVESESSGRRAVSLDNSGDYVEWTAPVNGNSLVVRYSIPDSAGGGGVTIPLVMRVNGSPVHTFTLTSQYAWVYGNFPWGNNPSAGNAHKFYDEVHVKLGSSYSNGDTITLVKPDNATSYIIIDLVDFEQVDPPGTMPVDSLSIIDYGAVVDGSTDSTVAVENCIAAAKSGGKEVWIPEGTFKIGSIDVSCVTIRGAGMWYSRFSGPNSRFQCTGDDCRFYDFAVFGSTDQRDDEDGGAGNAFNGNPGSGSRLERIWVERKKCAFWVGDWQNTTPPDGLVITECRFRNLMADAVNLCSGTSNSIIDSCSVRNSGDDSLACWSPLDGGPLCRNNIISNNVIQGPWLANGIALYGGSGHVVINNEVYDTVTTGAAVYIAANFGAWLFSDTITVTGNRSVRCGTNESYLGYPTGGMWVIAWDKSIPTEATIQFYDNDIEDASRSGLTVQGPMEIIGVLLLKDLRIDGSNDYALDVIGTARGGMYCIDVAATGSGIGGLRNSAGASFTINNVSGNSGW
jgi:hypothetical protein